jgi:hypothetical protein
LDLPKGPLPFCGEPHMIYCVSRVDDTDEFEPLSSFLVTSASGREHRFANQARARVRSHIHLESYKSAHYYYIGDLTIQEQFHARRYPDRAQARSAHEIP